MEIGQIGRNLLAVSPANAIAFFVLCSGAVATQEPAAIAQNQANQVLTDATQSGVVPTSDPPDPTSEVLEKIEQYSQEPDADTSLEQDDSMEQVTNVSQLRDVRPGDWAYEAVRSLIERYGVLGGYPDGTFRGNRTMTRYEFAAALDQVFTQIEELLRQGITSIPEEEFAFLQRLKDEFVVELALLRGDVDGLTARTIELELTQFSTTTKLDGEVVFGLTSIVNGEDANGNDVDGVTTFGHRTRLNLETSFTGRDLLRTRLQAEGMGSLERRTLTPEGELAFTGGTDSNVQLDALLYSFPIGDRTQVVIAANAGAADDFASTVNPYLDGDGASGALSRFATRHPIYYLVSGAGVGIRHAFSEGLELSLGYLAGDAGNPAQGGGLFDGSYGALAQVVFQPNEQLTLGLTYVHAYNNYLQTGSNSANLLGLTTVSNSFGVEASFQINPRFFLGGWVGYTAADVINQGDASIWNWALTAAFPDLGKTGNLAGILIGMEPKVTGSDDRLANLGIDDPSTSLHLEAFYQYQLTDNITITPGIIWLTAPDHNSANADVVIGTVRTTFRF
ncbi:MAG: iron uptake porin [Coleofasciculus sp. S288]|nr:iron uptake porin [Coleofasciculus sp. S288]